MSKRIISLVMALIMMCSLFSLSAFAEGTNGVTLAVSSASAKAGENVTVSVSISNNPGVMAMILGFDYDHDVLSLQSVQGSGFTNWEYAEKAVWVGTEDSTYNGEILKLNFKINENAAVGDTSVSVTAGAGDVANYNEEAIAVNCVAGKITVRPSVELAITSQPQSYTGAANDTAVFKVAAVGEGLSYQWQYSSNGGKTWNNSSGAAAKTDTFSVVLQSHRSGYQYRCKVTDANNTVKYSEAATLTLYEFAITSQPDNYTGAANDTAVFKVEAIGEGLNYQWQYSSNGGKTWNNSSGAAAKTDTFSVVLQSYRNGYQYRCKITDANNTVKYSEAATITIYEFAIVSQPDSYMGAVNDTAVFGIDAIGDGLKYQWQYSKDGGKTWSSSSGDAAKTDTFSVVLQAYRDGYQYRCKVTDAGGNVKYSEAATLTIYEFAIVSQPDSYMGALNDTAVFSVEAIGDGLKYQWQYSKDGGKSWSNSSGDAAKTATFSVVLQAYRDGYQYRCKVTDAGGNIKYSEAATLTLYEFAIVSQPDSYSGAVNDTAVFGVEAIGDGLKYQWQYSKDGGKSWSNSSGDAAKTATFSVVLQAYRDGYQYRCKVTDKYGNVEYSETATLDLYEFAITEQPESYMGALNDNAVFKVEAMGDGLSYQWQFSKDGGKTWSNSSGTAAKKNSFSVTLLDYRNGYQYRCKVTDANGSVEYSDAATLALYEFAIVSQPESYSGALNDTAVFKIEAVGNGLSYQWQYSSNGGKTWSNSSGNAAKTATFSVVLQAYRDGYQYRCKVTDADGNVEYSEVAVLSLNAINVTEQPESVSCAQGGTAQFAVAAEGNDLTYQWYYRTSANGTWTKSSQSDATTAALKIEAKSYRNGYQYRCKVTDAEGNYVYSDAATLTVK